MAWSIVFAVEKLTYTRRYECVRWLGSAGCLAKLITSRYLQRSPPDCIALFPRLNRSDVPGDLAWADPPPYHYRSLMFIMLEVFVCMSFGLILLFSV